jgi:hypothetical protein
VLILPMLFGPFSTTEAPTWRACHDLSRREGTVNLMGTIKPAFKDLAQTWEWKMITVHEKMYL